MKAIEARLRAGMAGAGDHRRGRGRDRPLDHLLRPLRLPRVARGELRPHRLRERLPEVPPPRGLHLRAPQQPADGLLPPVHAGEGRAAPRGALPAGGRDAERRAAARWRRGEVRLGLRYVRGLRAEAAERIEAERALRPFASLQDFVDRTGLRRDEQRNLAEVGRPERLRPHAAERAVAGGEGRAAARAAAVIPRSTVRAGRRGICRRRRRRIRSGPGRREPLGMTSSPRWTSRSG